jgi:8-oxo-dGTP diphosphatase
MNLPEIVAGIIERDGLILIACRAKGENKGKWEFPGGKVEEGETLHQALIREIKEEFDSEVMPGKKISTVPLNVADEKYLMTSLHTKPLTGEFIPVDPEYTEARWVPVCEFDDIDFAPADRLVAGMVINSADISS